MEIKNLALLIHSHSLTQLKTLYTIVKKVQDSNNCNIEFSEKELKETIQFKNKNRAYFIESIEELQNKPLTVFLDTKTSEKKHKRDYDRYSLIKTLKIRDKKVSVNFNEDFYEYALNQFSASKKLDILMQFKKIHAFRLFQVFNDFRNLGQFTFQVDYLQEILNTKYSRFTDLYKNSIKKAIEEINEISDIEITGVTKKFKDEKTKKSVSAVTFYFKSKQPAKKEKITALNINVMEAIENTKKNLYFARAFNNNYKAIKDLIQENSEEMVIKALKHFQVNVNNPVKTPALKKYLQTCIATILENEQIKKSSEVKKVEPVKADPLPEEEQKPEQEDTHDYYAEYQELEAAEQKKIDEKALDLFKNDMKTKHLNKIQISIFNKDKVKKDLVTRVLKGA